MAVKICFEDPITERVSEEFGPYESVQILNGYLLVDPDKSTLAHISDGWWYIDKKPNGPLYSNIIIFAYCEPPKQTRG